MPQFQAKLKGGFFRPLIWIGIGSQAIGAAIVLFVTWLFSEYAPAEFVWQARISAALLVSGAVLFGFASHPGEFSQIIRSVLELVGVNVKPWRVVPRSYHERHQRIFAGLFYLAILDFVIVAALDLQSGGIWRSPFTPMLPAIAAVGSLLLLPRQHLLTLYLVALVLLFIGLPYVPLPLKIQHNWGYFPGDPELPSYEKIQELTKHATAMAETESYSRGLLPRDDYEAARERHERQRRLWILAITIVGLFSGAVSAVSAFQAGTRLKYFFPPEQGRPLPRPEGDAKEDRELAKGYQELIKLVYDSENEFNQLFLCVGYMANYQPHQTEVHDIDEVRNQAVLLSIPVLHQRPPSRFTVEARAIALTTFAIHWLDDRFDSKRHMADSTIWKTIYEGRTEPCREIIGELDKNLHREGQCPLEEMLDLICMASPDPNFRTERAIKRILYGALIQHAPNEDVRKKLGHELREFVVDRLNNPDLRKSVMNLSPWALWLTCKSVVELLHAMEKPLPPLDVSEVCNFFFAPLVGWSDRTSERNQEKAEGIWDLVDKDIVGVKDMVTRFQAVYSAVLEQDDRKDLRLRQMVEVHRYYRQHLPESLKSLYDETVGDLRVHPTKTKTF